MLAEEADRGVKGKIRPPQRVFKSVHGEITLGAKRMDGMESRENALLPAHDSAITSVRGRFVYPRYQG